MNFRVSRDESGEWVKAITIQISARRRSIHFMLSSSNTHKPGKGREDWNLWATTTMLKGQTRLDKESSSPFLHASNAFVQLIMLTCECVFVQVDPLGFEYSLEPEINQMSPAFTALRKKTLRRLQLEFSFVIEYSSPHKTNEKWWWRVIMIKKIFPKISSRHNWQVFSSRESTVFDFRKFSLCLVHVK